jgi:serine protease inhibitor
MLVSAIYFQRNWKNQFDYRYTNPETFHVDEDNDKQVKILFER